MKLIRIRARRIIPTLADTQPGRCTATTRAGTRCRLPAYEGTGRCLVHLPSPPTARPA